MGCAAAELGDVDLGDCRLNKRVSALLDTLPARPTVRIPSACSGWAETVAAHRFLSIDEAAWEGILKPHWACSRRRIDRQKVVLMLRDTTELNFDGQTIEGPGPLSDEAQRDLYGHPTYAVSTSREPWGVLDARMWAPELKNADGQRPVISESMSWADGYERVAELATELPDTRRVCAGDRESDMTESDWIPVVHRHWQLGFAVRNLDCTAPSDQRCRSPDGTDDPGFADGLGVGGAFLARACFDVPYYIMTAAGCQRYELDCDPAERRADALPPDQRYAKAPA